MTEPTEEVLLNRLAAIRAAAEILDDYQELSHGDRQTFLTIIQSETARLNDMVERMATLFPDCLKFKPAVPA